MSKMIDQIKRSLNRELSKKQPDLLQADIIRNQLAIAEAIEELKQSSLSSHSGGQSDDQS